MRAKAKKTPMCSVSLIAIELKGLAAPGEALKNYNVFNYIFKDWGVFQPKHMSRLRVMLKSSFQPAAIANSMPPKPSEADVAVAALNT